MISCSLAVFFPLYPPFCVSTLVLANEEATEFGSNERTSVAEYPLLETCLSDVIFILKCYFDVRWHLPAR